MAINRKGSKTRPGVMSDALGKHPSEWKRPKQAKARRDAQTLRALRQQAAKKRGKK